MQSKLKSHSCWLTVTFLIVSAAPQVLSEDTVDSHTAKHMGVATCANTVCHGVRLLENDSNVEQNEYQSWLLQDPHSKAYKTLLSAESQSIANKLGLESAATTKVCLDCHADNVPHEQRGPEFLISDGVGCEACHGGSENWLGSHLIKPYSAERNYADGMYPTAPLQQRAELCVSCHVGTPEKFASHDIMGAGHPRLSFELDTFSNRQPVHHVIDADYITRKNQDLPATRLLIGMAVQAQTVAKNLTSELLENHQGHPDLSLFNCHACHNSLNDLQWQKRPSTIGLRPGSIRLNDSSFLLLAALTGALDLDLQRQLFSSIKELHTASAVSVNAVKEAANNLINLTDSTLNLFEQSDLTPQVLRQMIQGVTKLGVDGEYQDYIAAEQAVMALDALSQGIAIDSKFTLFIDEAYRLTENDETYQPKYFKQLLQDAAK